jgi:hypothetical protein
MKFPSWLEKNEGGAYVVNTDEAYPEVLKVLGLEKDQYSIEVAYQCIKLKVQDLVAASDDDPREQDPPKPLVILMESAAKAAAETEEDAIAAKEKWALRKYPEGRGAAAATKGREARDHYERVRHKFG